MENQDLTKGDVIMEDGEEDMKVDEEDLKEEKKVEDMTYEEKILHLKDYNYYKDFKLNMWIDA